MLDVTVISPQKVLFQGQGRRVILPGEQGVFEIWPFHRALMSRLLPGLVVIDDEAIPIQRGVVNVERNRVTVVAETEKGRSETRAAGEGR